MKLSARNQLAGTVTEIRRGEAIANVVIDVAGQRLVSSITVEAVEQLGLAPGSRGDRGGQGLRRDPGHRLMALSARRKERPHNRSFSVAMTGSGEVELPLDALAAEGMGTEDAYELIRAALLLDGQSRLNLATFVTTWMPELGATADGRDSRQEHDRQGRVSADGRDRDPLREHPRRPVELPGGRVGDRLLDDRLERGGDARRDGAQVALACAARGRRQGREPAEPGDGRERPGVLGEVLPLLGGRAADGADGGRHLPPHARARRRAVRREHDRRGGDPRLDVRRQLRAGRRDRGRARRARADEGDRRPDPRRRCLRGLRRARSSIPTWCGTSGCRACSRSTRPVTNTASSTRASAGRCGATSPRFRRSSSSTSTTSAATCRRSRSTSAGRAARSSRSTSCS